MTGEPAPGGAAMAAAEIARLLHGFIAEPIANQVAGEIEEIIWRYFPAPPESGMLLRETEAVLSAFTAGMTYENAPNGAWSLVDIRNRIRAALSAAPAEEGWRDISTAPKDGTRVLLRRMIDTTKFPNLPEIGWIKVGKWVADWQDGYEEAWREDAVPRGGRESAIRLSPTDWQPLPASRPGGRR